MTFNYNINFNRIVKENIPSFLHRVVRIARIRAMIKPFRIINTEFAGIRVLCNYEIKFNASVILFEYYLNTYFGTVWSNLTGASEIYIVTNGIDSIGFRVSEDVDTTSMVGEFVGEAVISETYSWGTYNFTIYVPAAVFTALGANDAIREGIIRSIADKFNIAGMIYNIIPYT